MHTNPSGATQSKPRKLNTVGGAHPTAFCTPMKFRGGAVDEFECQDATYRSLHHEHETELQELASSCAWRTLQDEIKRWVVPTYDFQDVPGYDVS